MRYPCNIIRDIMPLYHDGVVSKESEIAVIEHLEECEACKAYYREMCQADSIGIMDEQIEAKGVEAFAKVGKKICRWIVRIPVATVLIIFSFFAAILIMWQISAALTWEKHTNIEEYGLLKDGSNVLGYFEQLKGDGDQIWPAEITNDMNVLEYKLIYYNPFDPNYLGYLTVQYDAEAYEAECKRLSECNTTEYIGRYGVTGFEDCEVLAIIVTGYGLVYAISNQENVITYVGIFFCNYFTDIKYEKHVPQAYLPEGMNLGADGPARLCYEETGLWYEE